MSTSQQTLTVPELQTIGASENLGNDGSTADKKEKKSNREAALADIIESPAPDSFQRFVATSTGRILPIFGASFFGKAPTTFAPATRVPVTADYVVGPDDEIILQVWGQQDFSSRLTVSRDGSIYIPRVGSIAVAGLRYSQLQEHLREQLGRVFRNFDLNVNMGRLRSIQIYVTGNARQTGLYTVSSLSTLVNALFTAGGPRPEGSMRRIQLKRGGSLITELDLYDLMLRGDKSGDVRLQPEDVIYVPAVGPRVALSGSLKNPAIYEIKNEKTLDAVIEMAGGLSPLASREHATIERIHDGVAREVLDVTLDAAGMSIAVSDGDLLRVSEITPRFDNTVTLRGYVTNPGRFAWQSGMRLRDIIPDQKSLISRDYWRLRNQTGNIPVGSRNLWNDPPTQASETTAPVVEKNAPLDVDYFVKRNLMEQLSPRERTELELKAEAMAKPERIELWTQGSANITARDINWSYALIERIDTVNLKTKLIPFHLGNLVLKNDERENLELMAGDIITIFSQADIRVPQMQQTRTILLEGEFVAPGLYTVEPGETLQQVIERAGGLTSQAYIYGAEFTRESTRRDQQLRLEKYIMDLAEEADTAARNRLANATDSTETSMINTEIETQRQSLQQMRALRSTGRIVLGLGFQENDITAIASMTIENGDRLMVPARPSVVNVIGEVYNPNSFIYDNKRKVKDYLKLAGGYTRSADNDRIYIIRADGSVLPRQNVPGFDKIELRPGDSLVIPQHLFKTTFIRELRNWSQVVSQFGLGVAAINVLR